MSIISYEIMDIAFSQDLEECKGGKNKMAVSRLPLSFKYTIIYKTTI